MYDKTKIMAELVGGPFDGAVGDHHNSVAAITMPSAFHKAVEHRYDLGDFDGGVAHYYYSGAVGVDHGASGACE